MTRLPSEEPRLKILNGATLTIVLANAVPLAGVLYFQWQLLELVRLFLCELALLVAWQGLRVLVQAPKEKKADYLAGLGVGGFSIACVGTAILDQMFDGQAVGALPALAAPVTLLAMVHGARTLRNMLHSPRDAAGQVELEIAALVLRCGVSSMALGAMSVLVTVANAAMGGFILLVLVKTLVEVVAESFGQYERELRRTQRLPSGNSLQD